MLIRPLSPAALQSSHQDLTKLSILKTSMKSNQNIPVRLFSKGRESIISNKVGGVGVDTNNNVKVVNF